MKHTHRGALCWQNANTRRMYALVIECYEHRRVHKRFVVYSCFYSIYNYIQGYFVFKPLPQTECTFLLVICKTGTTDKKRFVIRLFSAHIFTYKPSVIGWQRPKYNLRYGIFCTRIYGNQFGSWTMSLHRQTYENLHYAFVLILFLRSAFSCMYKKEQRSPDLCDYFSDIVVRRVV